MPDRSLALEEICAAVDTVAAQRREQVLNRFDQLAKPPHSLGRLEAVVADLAAIQDRQFPLADTARLWLFAADHGLAEAGISAWPQSVTGGMLGCFVRGGAAVNQICRANQIEFRAVDAGVAEPPRYPSGYESLSMGAGTASAARGKAMSTGQAAEAMGRAHRLLTAAEPADLVVLGEMGIGNTAAAALMTHALTGADLDDCVGPGAGQDAAGLARKREVLAAVVERHGRPAEPLAILSCYGGFEIAMMAGAALAAAARRQAVLVDGFIATVAVALACRMAPALRDYCIFCHRSAEPGHTRLLAHLRAEPLLELDMALGEGTGAAMAVPLIRAALACHSDMETVADVLAAMPGETGGT